MNKKKKKCERCRYWKGPIALSDRYCPPEEMQKGDFGYCKRHAPYPSVEEVVQSRGKIYLAIWPETSSEDYCGEFEMIDLGRE